MPNLKAKAYHLGGNLSIQNLKEKLQLDVIRAEAEYVLFRKAENEWIYVKNYGSVVFINISEENQLSILQSLGSSLNMFEMPYDDMLINVEENNEVNVDHGVIIVPAISDNIAHVIAINLAETVVLDDFQKKVEVLLEVTSKYSLQLKRTGLINLSRRKIRKIIGETMILKNRIAENLYIYDTPDIVWDDAVLAHLDEQIRKDLEIEKRHHGLHLHLDIVKENLEMYQNILQHRHSTILEWIIIGLILFEVLQVIIEKI